MVGSMNNDKTVCEEKKHLGGKMVKVCIKAGENNVKGIIITGDFFAEPEEKFDEIIRKLIDLEAGLDDALTNTMNIFRNENIKLYGISLEDIEDVVKRAITRLKRQ
ncbi:MAG: hypothetical protein N3E36_01360 [Sulfolobales archaeon]|nr:hypothetical protein [Sulfolobales archaeon]